MRARSLLAPSWAAGAALLGLADGIASSRAFSRFAARTRARTGAPSLAATTATAPPSATATAAAWEFRTADDCDVPVMAGLLRQKGQFHFDMTGEHGESRLAPSQGGTLASLFPELPTGQVLLIRERPEGGRGYSPRAVTAEAQSARAARAFPPPAAPRPTQADSESLPEGAVGFALYALRHYGLDGSVPPSLWLHALFVDPSKRSGGAGRALMDELASLAGGHRCSHLGWKCHVDNVRGQGFYEKMGARRQSHRAGDLYSYAWVPDSWSAPSAGAPAAAAAAAAACPR
jgi:GNAT superfamily N-acetyltransferase